MTVIECISPVDGSVYAEREALGFDAAKAAIARARKAQTAWARRPLEERVRLVMKGVARLNDMADEVVPEIAWQMGRPIRYGGEFRGFNERAAYMASVAAEALKPYVVEDSASFERRIEREPYGLVIVIAPWNYPYMTAINTVAPALMAGNAVVIKHASQTLLVGERMVRAFVEAGLPEDVFVNLFLDHDTTSRLIADGNFNFINFTGSVAGGRAVERAAAGTFAGLGLELGGKDPAYVMEDAALDAAVDTLMDGAFFNSGQCCCGIERVYVHESLFDRFVEQSVAFVSAYRLGNPLDQATTLGPMAHKRLAAIVRAQISEALSKGAKGLVDQGLFPADDRGAYRAPQILVDVDHSMNVMRDESFGPVVGIMKVRNDAEALELMNDSPYGLTASLWTQDTERATRIGQNIETGTVFMNRADYLDPALCWTGVKETGKGGSLSVLSFQNLTRPKSYHFKKVL